MPEESTSARPHFWSEIKPIFLKWEKLRVVYNLILVVTLLIVLPGSGLPLLHAQASVLLLVLGFWLLCGVGANILFLAGPAAEAYARWLGLKGRWITIVLFAGGVLISIPLVFFCALGGGAFFLHD